MESLHLTTSTARSLEEVNKFSRGENPLLLSQRMVEIASITWHFSPHFSSSKREDKSVITWTHLLSLFLIFVCVLKILGAPSNLSEAHFFNFLLQLLGRSSHKNDFHALRRDQKGSANIFPSITEF